MTKEQENIIKNMLTMGEMKAHEEYSEDPIKDLWQSVGPKFLWTVVAESCMLGCGEVFPSLELESPLFAWDSKDMASNFVPLLEEKIKGKAVVKEVICFHHPLVYYNGTYILKPGVIATERDKMFFLKAMEWKPVGPKKPVTKIGGAK